MKFPLSSMPTFRDGILCVFLRSSESKMVGANTRWVVADVHDVHPGRHGSVV